MCVVLYFVSIGHCKMDCGVHAKGLSRRAEETSCGFMAICMPLPGDTILWSAARVPVPIDGAVAQWQMEPPYLRD